MPGQRFPIRIGARSRLFLRLWGVRPDVAWVEVDDRDVHVRFGLGDIRTPISNVETWRIEGPWRWITAIGIRRSFRHGDVSFAGSPRGGVRLDLREPIAWSILRIPAIYVGVDDLEGFAATLALHGIPGTDARTRRE